MQLFIKFLSIFIVILILQTAGTQIPGCNFEDTVALSASQSLRNGSYLYQGIVVPAFWTGQFEYIKTENGYRSVKLHLRGCVCKFKPCIPFCCRFKHTQKNGECNDDLMEQLNKLNPYVKVTLSNGSVVRRNLLQDFIVLRDQMRPFDVWQEDSYTFYENGTILLGDYKGMTTENGYRGYDCLHPSFGSGDPNSLVAAFHSRIYQPTMLQAEAGIMLLSEIFLIFMIAMYLCVKKLRSLQGKCFISYMICTFIFMPHWWLVQFEIPNDFCALKGYLNYFFFLSKFIWLFIMHYRKWKGLTSDNRIKSPYNYLNYSIFAWGLAALMTALLLLIDQIWENEPSQVKLVPGVGYENCDLKQSWISHSAYVSLPIIFLLTLSATLLILTTLKIIKVKRYLKNCVVQDVRTAWLRSKIKTYNIFVRLFIIMVLESSVRLIVFYADDPFLIDICYYIDYSIGIIIFVMFILRCRMIRLLMTSNKKLQG